MTSAYFQSLALESTPYNIAVNTVGPGKGIKTTDVTWEQFDALPAEAKAGWTDPIELGRAFVWLAAQPPDRFNGLRFDAGPIADTIEAEGYEFDFAPEKVTLYVDDFKARLDWQANYPD